MNRFIEDLSIKLNKTRAPVTTGAYIRRLKTLNDNKVFSSMKFLMDTKTIIEKIEATGLTLNTQTSYLTAIVAVLSTFPKYSKIYKLYREKMILNANKIKAGYATNEKTEKQKESVIELSEVITIRDELDKDSIEYLLLSLYTMCAPRRNKDYTEMFIVFDEPAELDTNKNYYVVSEKQFIFNIYKTAKLYGVQRIDVPDKLSDVLDNWIEKHPMNSEDEFPLLVDKGKRINNVNGITRILNNVFKKKIGSSALRHIFLNDKFSDSLVERKKIALEMAHSVSTQNSYIVK